jgi:hypothetical protein
MQGNEPAPQGDQRGEDDRGGQHDVRSSAAWPSSLTAARAPCNARCVQRPRILLVPTVTELEWRIAPLLSEWAEVATYDVPGVGQEPPVEPMDPGAVAERA